MSRYHNRADIRLAYRHLMFFNEKNPEVGMVVWKKLRIFAFERLKTSIDILLAFVIFRV